MGNQRWFRRHTVNRTDTISKCKTLWNNMLTAWWSVTQIKNRLANIRPIKSLANCGYYWSREVLGNFYLWKEGKHIMANYVYICNIFNDILSEINPVYCKSDDDSWLTYGSRQEQLDPCLTSDIYGITKITKSVEHAFQTRHDLNYISLYLKGINVLRSIKHVTWRGKQWHSGIARKWTRSTSTISAVPWFCFTL